MKSFSVAKLINSTLIRQCASVFTGNLFAAGLGFLAVLIVSRKLTVSDFGLFTIALSVIRLVSSLSSLGMDTGMIKHASSFLIDKKTIEAKQVFKTTFIFRLTLSFIIAGIVFASAGLLSTKVFHCSGLAYTLKFAAFGGFTVSLVNYIRSVYHAYQSFKTSICFQVLADFGKFISIIVLSFFLCMNVNTAVAIFAFVPVLSVILGFWKLRNKVFSTKKILTKNICQQLFSYNKWLAMSSVCGLILPHVSIFMLATMLDSEASGLYGLALNLTYIFPILIGSLNAVLLPKVSRYREIAQIERYIKNSLKTSIGISLIILPFLFFSSKIILFFFGSRYRNSVPIFNWLLLSGIIGAITTPLRAVLYSMNKPRIITITDTGALITVLLGCYFLIPFIGITTPAILLLLVNVSVLCFSSFYIFNQIRRESFILSKVKNLDIGSSS